MKTSLKDKFKRAFNLPLAIIYSITAAAVVCHILFYFSSSFAGFFNTYISAYIRCAISTVTRFIPFSLAEGILFCLPLIVVLLFVFSGRIEKHFEGNTPRYTLAMFAAVAILYSTFALSFAPAYQTDTLDVRLGLERKSVTAQELKKTAQILLDKAEAELDSIDFMYGSFSVMPYSLDEMNDRLCGAYKKTAARYDWIISYPTNLKYVILSELMTYTHISGVYSYYTGEANLNINFPDYSLPFTAAHEMSHQRGIAREEEANFMAFLVCTESDNPYIRYSGYLSVYEYVSSALYDADSNAYYEVLRSMDARILYEQIAYNEFFDKYRVSTVSDVTSAVNDTFLKSQGQSEGTNSYGLVVDLAVAFYR